MILLMEILYVIALLAVLYFCVISKVIKLLRCRVKVKGVITGYKKTVLSNYHNNKRIYVMPICDYTYEGKNYNEVVDFRVNAYENNSGEELEFYINMNNPKVAVKTSFDEVFRMVIIGIGVCIMGVSLLGTKGIVEVDLTKVVLRLLGMFFVGAYIYNVWVNVIQPIKSGAFSKSIFDFVFLSIQVIAMLTVGTIFFVLGIVFIMGEEQTQICVNAIKNYLNR